MLATDRFLLISVGRTGTGALHKWLQEVPGLRIISNLPHEPYRIMAEKCRAAGIPVPPAWTIIRNPWDYYLDKHLWERDRGPCFQGTFREFLQKTRGQPIVEGYFYSLTQKWHDLGADRSAYVGRFECYVHDVVRILCALVPDLLTEEQIKGHIVTNQGYGQSLTDCGQPQWCTDYRPYYTPETYWWVKELDGELIERFRYSF